MKKTFLIVIANYYKNISFNLVKSAMDEIKNSFNIHIFKIFYFQSLAI